MSDRESLRATFVSVAAAYADARPTYPPELFSALVEATGIGPGSLLRADGLLRRRWGAVLHVAARLG